ncbi:hypothetical protein HHI36_002371 [Cryptolaemus montrouzieri]|uniref:N-acetylneuraminate lyase n=1 Tax=Cryptolaemus montrouzieri TaxID=559131 RepID=A0ABD2PBR3_9CUCU
MLLDLYGKYRHKLCCIVYGIYVYIGIYNFCYKMNFHFRGLIAPVFTPFKKNMEINLDIIDNYSQFLLRSGIKGVLVNGTTGEGPSLSKEERKIVAEKWKVSVSSTNQHLMVQVGGAPLPDVIDLAKHAEQIGVDSLLCLPELYFKPKSIEELIHYLKVIGSSAPNTPLLYYHIPSFSNVHLNMKHLMKAIVDVVPTFCGIKFTSTCLDEGHSAHQVYDGNYPVFLGADNVLAGAFTLGFDSAIATTLNILPQLSIDILNAINISDLKKARDRQEKLNTIIEIITQNGDWVPTMKCAMNLLTPINVGEVRNPLSNLEQNHVEEMQKKLVLLDV